MTNDISRQQRRAVARASDKEKKRLQKHRGDIIEQFKPRCPDCDTSFGREDHANQCNFCKVMICDGCVDEGTHDCRSSKVLSKTAAEAVIKAGRKCAVMAGGKLTLLTSMEDFNRYFGDDEDADTIDENDDN